MYNQSHNIKHLYELRKDIFYISFQENISNYYKYNNVTELFNNGNLYNLNKSHFNDFLVPSV